MAEKAENAVLYAAVYPDVEGALSDLGVFQQLQKDEMLGKYDAAVIDKEEGTSSNGPTVRPFVSSRSGLERERCAAKSSTTRRRHSVRARRSWSWSAILPSRRGSTRRSPEPPGPPSGI